MYIPRGKIAHNYEWSPKIMTKNNVEENALLQGLNLASSLLIRKLIVLGDSSLIINHMNLDTTPLDIHCTSILERIHIL